MRLVAWNCNGGFRKKIDTLLFLNPDIAVIPEALQTCLAELDKKATSSVWAGNAGSKGIAIIGFHGWQLTRIEIDVSDEWFVPVIATNGDTIVRVVGVWVKRADDGYVKPTRRALKSLREFISKEATFVVGDFNQNVQFDKGRGSGRRFQDVLTVFHELQMRSAWHAQSGDMHGAEGTPTLHWVWQANRAYHVDYAFVPNGLVQATRVSMGKFEDYVGTGISDHVPLTIDVDLRIPSVQGN
jgi:hypothetical protein